MSTIELRRVDPERNMARFYLMSVQPDLFGGWTLMREWGRIGQAGKLRCLPYPTQDEAEAALTKLQEAKLRRGYSPPGANSVSQR